MRTVFGGAAIALGLMSVSQASTWNSLGGNWDVASNWVNPANVPDTTSETAVINSTCNVRQDYSIGGLTVGVGAQLQGAHTITTQTFNWSGGQIITDLTTVTGQTTISNVNNNPLVLNGSILYTAGNTSQSGPSAGGGAFTLLTGSELDNTGVYSITDNSGIDTSGAGNSINNFGTFQKSGGTGTSRIYAFVNGGTLLAASGTLNVNMLGSTTSNAGVFKANSGCTLTLASNGTHTLTASCTVTGAGTVNFNGGRFQTTGTGSVVSNATTNTLTGSELDGKFQFNNLTWTYGTITSGGNVTVTTAATIAGNTSDVVEVRGGTLTLQGNTQLTATSDATGLRISNGGTLNNSGTFKLTTDAGIGIGTGTNVFNNTGTLLKSGGTGTSQVYDIVNTGTVNAQSGTLNLELKTAANASGTYLTSAGARLRLSAPGTADLTFGAATTFSGLGTFLCIDDQVTLQGTVQATGLTFQTADVNGNGTIAMYIPAAITNGTGLLGALGITKSGVGTLRMTGANTYTGTTTVSGGTLDTFPAAYNNILTNAGGINLSAAKTQFVLGSFTTSPIATVKSLLTTAYASNFASGQIRCSTAGTNLTLGYRDGGTYVLVMATLPGDANLDGKVDFNDFLVLQNNFNAANTRWDQGNFNYNGVTDFNDFLVLQNHFGQSIAGVAADPLTASQVAAIRAFANANAVPEPATLGLLLAGGVLAGRRRRR